MRYAILFLLFIVCLMFTACICPELKQHEKQLTLQVIEKSEQIPLPTIYCIRHGSEMVYSKPKAKLLTYGYTTGRAYFEVTCYYECPCSNFITRWWHGSYSYKGECGHVTLVSEDETPYPNEKVYIDQIKEGEVYWLR